MLRRCLLKKKETINLQKQVERTELRLYYSLNPKQLKSTGFKIVTTLTGSKMDFVTYKLLIPSPNSLQVLGFEVLPRYLIKGGFFQRSTSTKPQTPLLDEDSVRESKACMIPNPFRILIV